MPEVFLYERNDKSGATATDYSRFVFHRPEFLRQFRDVDMYSFYLMAECSGRIRAEIHFTIQDKLAVSPFRGSFGSYQFADDLPEATLHRFHDEVIGVLRKEHVEMLRIRNHPSVYAPRNYAKIQNMLLLDGFQLLYTDLNYHLDSGGNFQAGLKESEWARIRSLENKGFVSEWWERPDTDILYQVLKENRDYRGYPLTMTRQDFKNMFHRMSDTYRAFRVIFRGNTIAAGVCVKINPQILYNFYAGELPAFRKYSPVAGLIQCMYQYAFACGCEIFDLGIATDRGNMNEGLRRFKINMGGIPSEKSFYQKILS